MSRGHSQWSLTVPSSRRGRKEGPGAVVSRRGLRCDGEPPGCLHKKLQYRAVTLSCSGQCLGSRGGSSPDLALTLPPLRLGQAW
jgi:hypothetical protein